MGKCCCAVYCSNRFSKGCGLHFFHFPADPDRRNLWVAAVNRKNLQPSPYMWICSSHFIGGAKSDDPTFPSYSPSIFAHLSLGKRQGESQLARCNRSKKRCVRIAELLSNPSVPSSPVFEPLPSSPEAEPLSLSPEAPSQDLVSHEQACNTDMSMRSIENLESDCSSLHIENILLNSELKSLKEYGFMS